MASTERLGRYKIVRLLGRGGVAEVYLARLDGPGGYSRPVAIKRLKDVYRDEPAYRRQLIAEARVGALLDHPNILTYFELCEDGREIFIVTEYLHGVTTRQLIHTAATHGEFLPVAVALHVTAELLTALGWAHEAVDDRGVPMRLVHRDISPENVFLALNGAIKLIDFGIAETPISPRDTRVHVVKGKARYFSPEQARGADELSASSDVYSVGLMLFELLTGTPAIDGDTDRIMLERAARGELVSAAEMRPELPRAVLAILDSALSAAVARRYPDANLMLAAVREAQAHLGADRGRRELDATLRRFFGDELETRRRSIWNDRSTAIVDIADIERDSLTSGRVVNPPPEPDAAPPAFDVEAAEADPLEADTLAEMDIAGEPRSQEPESPQRPSSLGFDRLRRAVSDAYASTRSPSDD